MVDPSLTRQAADRGVTICIADLDGADGLWVPEERTVLVSRRLSEQEIAAVIEHELEHVAIDDGHADLDAATRRPPARSTYWPAALTAAACLAVVGGITAGLMGQSPGDVRQEPVVAPSRPGLTGSAPTPSPGATTTVVGTNGPNGVRTNPTITVTRTGAAPPPVAGTPTSPAATRSAATAPATSQPPAADPPPQSPASSFPTSAPAQTTEPPPTGNPSPSATPTQTESVAADTDSGKPGKSGKSGGRGGS